MKSVDISMEPSVRDRKAVILDLNGTLILPVTPDRLGDYYPIAGAADAVALLCRAGFLCPVVTVQSRVEKGFYTEFEFREWFRSFSDKFAASGARLLGPYVCPHRFTTPCACKKADGLLHKRAEAELSIHLPSSYVVGDSADDVAAARMLGCCAVRVRTGWPVAKEDEAACDYVADNLLDAARWIVNQR